MRNGDTGKKNTHLILMKNRRFYNIFIYISFESRVSGDFLCVYRNSVNIYA